LTTERKSVLSAYQPLCAEACSPPASGIIKVARSQAAVAGLKSPIGVLPRNGDFKWVYERNSFVIADLLRRNC
jgi:hypothetical protein